MVDSFTWQNVLALKGPSSVAKKGTKQIMIIIKSSFVLPSEAVDRVSYAQEPINTYI